MLCRIRIPLPSRNPHRRKAAVMSKTPQARPPVTIAAKALELPAAPEPAGVLMGCARSSHQQSTRRKAHPKAAGSLESPGDRCTYAARFPRFYVELVV